MQTISNLHLSDFINLNVLNIGSSIDPYDDWFIPKIFWVSRYAINTLCNFIGNFKTYDQGV